MEKLRVNLLRSAKLCVLIKLTCQYFCQEIWYTISTCVEELAANVRQQPIEKRKQFEFFFIACDETTDITDTVQLLIFVRSVNINFIITEDFTGMKY